MKRIKSFKLFESTGLDSRNKTDEEIQEKASQIEKPWRVGMLDNDFLNMLDCLKSGQFDSDTKSIYDQHYNRYGYGDMIELVKLLIEQGKVSDYLKDDYPELAD